MTVESSARSICIFVYAGLVDELRGQAYLHRQQEKRRHGDDEGRKAGGEMDSGAETSGRSKRATVQLRVVCRKGTERRPIQTTGGTGAGLGERVTGLATWPATSQPLFPQDSTSFG